MNRKAIIFDWGRTLHDPESDSLFLGVPELLAKLSQSYKLALVSLAKSESPELRIKKIEESGIAKSFEIILVGGEDKNEMYDKVLDHLEVLPEETAIVDDRTLRGITWGNTCGAATIWFKNGKFACELPTPETGNPTHMITDIRELEALFC